MSVVPHQYPATSNLYLIVTSYSHALASRPKHTYNPFSHSLAVGSARSRAKKTQTASEWQAHRLSASASAWHPTTCEHESNTHRYPFLPYLSLHCMSGSVSYRVCAKLTWRRRKTPRPCSGKNPGCHARNVVFIDKCRGPTRHILLEGCISKP